jgi:TolB-like protein/DNA-binding SARP family transcriptional activator/Tfp pilus assembly protein PilF
MLHLRTFGGLALQREGTALDVVNAQRKALALLAVLASAGSRGIGRDKLMVLLWPESDAGRARGALKQMLHTLRRHLGSAEAILGTAELRLNPDHVESDVVRFRSALEAGEPEIAIALYHGPFLDGVHLDGSPDFDEWLEQQRAELERNYLDALERLACAVEAAGDLERAAAWWRRLQAADPLNGRVALRLMQALEASGDRAAALRYASVHRTMLRQQLGIAPDPAVIALAERLHAPSGPLPHDETIATTPSTSRTAPGHERDPSPDGVEQPGSITGEPSWFARTAGVPRLAWMALAAMLSLAAALVMGTTMRGVPVSGSEESGGAQPGAGDVALVPAIDQGSIAVLPFIDLSPEQDQEYFSDGITEELITHLSRMEGLKVPARTSSFQFKGARADVREVGRRLGVIHVLEGSVRKAGDRLRITVQLVDAENGFHVWAETYDRPMRDVFVVQEEISLAVVDALRIHLARGGGRGVAQRRTSSVEAYELYLKGRFFANRRTSEGLDRAAEYFEQAVAIDPHFAGAYVGLADTRIAPRSSAPAERFEHATELVTTALALDSTLAEAHTSMAWIRMWYHRDWVVAERHLQRAIALDPGYLWAHQWHAAFLAAVGRNEESLVSIRRAQRIDPLSVSTHTHVGSHLFFLGRYEEAIHQYRKALELDPTFFMARWGLSRAYLHLGRHEEAIRELQYPGTDYLGFSRPALYGHASAVAGREVEARRVVAELREKRERGEYVAPTDIAAVYLGLGERTQALDWLEKHEVDRGARIFLKLDPIFAPLRAEPRFQQLLLRLGLE